jgi:hypothetical protein
MEFAIGVACLGILMYWTINSARDSSFVAWTLVGIFACIIFALKLIGVMIPDKQGNPSNVVYKLLDMIDGIGSATVSDSDTIDILVVKFRSADSSSEAAVVLRALRKRIRCEKSDGVKAMELLLPRYVMMRMESRAQEDTPPLYFDVLNELYHIEGARAVLVQNKAFMKECVDNFLVIIKDLMDQSSVFQKMNHSKEDDDVFDFDRAAEGKVLEAGSTGRAGVDNESGHVSQDSCFESYGHKALMVLGQLALSCEAAQTRIVDRGGLKLLFSCIKCFRGEAMAKWGMYASIHLSFNHPANKREIVDLDGLKLVTDALRAHSDSLEVTQQGLHLLFSIVSPDPRARMHLATVREAVSFRSNFLYLICLSFYLTLSLLLMPCCATVNLFLFSLFLTSFSLSFSFSFFSLFPFSRLSPTELLISHRQRTRSSGRIRLSIRSPTACCNFSFRITPRWLRIEGWSAAKRTFKRSMT